MIDFLQYILAGIGMTAAFFAISYGVVSGWTALSEASARKQKDAKRALELLERIEANTARIEPTTNDPS